jgi:hypothetical protein
MSNHLAAAAVTATLRKTLQAAVDAASPGVSHATVTTLRPNAPTTGPQPPAVNVFLYQITPSPQLRNMDVSTRRLDGSFERRPQAAMDLHYLISFAGDDARLEPQFLFGITARALHEQPVITRDMIQAMLSDPIFGFMAGSDLQSAPDLVRLTPVGLSLEELSKLWSVVFQTPYVLSQVYRASVIVIESAQTAQPRPPVRRTQVTLNATMGPVVDLVLSQATPTSPMLADAPITTGQSLVLVGRDLLGEVTRVRVGPVELEPDAASASAAMLKVVLTPDVPAGAEDVQVIRRKNVAPSSDDLYSGSIPFLLTPSITASFAAGAVDVGFTPPVGRTQQVTLELNQADAPAGQTPLSFTFDLPPRTPAGPPQASLSVPIPGVPAGRYLARVKVDGAESLLSAAPDTGRFDAPTVTVS